jgi:hypothetical protein
MKIIFLDIDGVLNNQLWYVKTQGQHRKQFDLDPDNIKYFNSIIEKTQAYVVLTSTWRLGRTNEECQNILNAAGFAGQVLDLVPDLRRGDIGKYVLRGNEIYAWMKNHETLVGAPYHEYKNYVILDDDSDMLYWQRNNLILIDPYVGLTPNSAYRAIKILNQ